MKLGIMFLIALIFTQYSFSQDKGYNIAVDKVTGEIVEMSYGDSGYQHRIDQGYTVIRAVPSSQVASIKELDHLKWNDKNSNSKVDTNEIVSKTNAEITTVENNKRKKTLKRQIIDLSIQRDKAKTLCYTDTESTLNTQVTNLKDELNAIP